ncbi:MAG TPA: TadE family protein [Candidatus Limnocylindrales bacterium]|jgi:Flp pilus assembly protein TadG|nr:TadE family protein [Candidatus Limnocylindrales bacterium]
MPRRPSHRSLDARHGASRRRGRILRVGRREEGQSLVEFALILTPLLFLLLGIVQFGFIFQAYITLSSATREAARDATVYVYDTTLTKAQNDTARNNIAKSSLLAAFNGLAKTSPNFVNGSSWTTTSGTGTVTSTNGDMTVTYVLPSTVTDSDPRAGWRVSVSASYHLDIIVPIIGNLLPKDSNGRFVIPAAVTMVIN